VPEFISVDILLERTKDPHNGISHSIKLLLQSARDTDENGFQRSYMQSLFIYDLEGKLRQKQSQGAAQPSQSLPYEFRALEAVLIRS
jgi:hypothetical protein